jgi:hypothetical protein
MEGPMGDTGGTSSDMLTPPELAARWRMSVRTLDRWRSQRSGPTWLRLGGHILYRLGDVEAFEKAHRQGASG